MVINSIYALQKDSRGISEMGFPVSILPNAVSSLMIAFMSLALYIL